MSNPIYLFIYLTLEITYSVFGGWGLVVQDWCLGFWYLKIALKCRNDETDTGESISEARDRV